MHRVSVLLTGERARNALRLFRDRKGPNPYHDHSANNRKAQFLFHNEPQDTRQACVKKALAIGIWQLAKQEVVL